MRLLAIVMVALVGWMCVFAVGATFGVQGFGAALVLVGAAWLLLTADEARAEVRKRVDAESRKGVVRVHYNDRNRLELGRADRETDTRVAVVDVLTDHHATCPDAARYRR